MPDARCAKIRARWRHGGPLWFRRFAIAFHHGGGDFRTPRGRAAIRGTISRWIASNTPKVRFGITGVPNFVEDPFRRETSCLTDAHTPAPTWLSHAIAERNHRFRRTARRWHLHCLFQAGVPGSGVGNARGPSSRAVAFVHLGLTNPGRGRE